MVRKTGLSRKYSLQHNEPLRRKNTTRITLLPGTEALLNYDDPLFLRSSSIDFVFRIEEVTYLTKILSLLYDENIGNDAKYYDYLQARQMRENHFLANVIIQK